MNLSVEHPSDSKHESIDPDEPTEPHGVEALARRPRRVISLLAGQPGPLPKPVPGVEDPRIATRLQELGYLPRGEVTGPRAIRNFQAMNKLPVTGELDQKTLDAMWSLAARKPFQVLTQRQRDDRRARARQQPPRPVAHRRRTTRNGRAEERRGDLRGPPPPTVILNRGPG